MTATEVVPAPQPPVMPDSWLAVAHSREVDRRPMAVRVADAEIVLFRDRAGVVRALQDRCCHRRVPLSLGRVTPEGTLQCAYHGWCYDGAGACVAIPQLRPEDRIPARFAVDAYPVRERYGFVWLWPADQAPRAEHDIPVVPFLVPSHDRVWRARIHLDRPSPEVMEHLAGSALGRDLAANSREANGLLIKTEQRSARTVSLAYSCIPVGAVATEVIFAVRVEGPGWLATAAGAAAAVATRLRVRFRVSR